MGFGLPAAIGAKVACPDALVIDIVSYDDKYDMKVLTNLSGRRCILQHDSYRA